jgi:hypothetical protein
MFNIHKISRYVDEVISFILNKIKVIEHDFKNELTVLLMILTTENDDSIVKKELIEQISSLILHHVEAIKRPIDILCYKKELIQISYLMLKIDPLM